MTEAVPKTGLDAEKRGRSSMKRFRSGGRWVRALVLGIAIATAIAFLHLTPFARQIEDRYGLGFVFSLRGPIPPPEGAIVAAIDKQSIDWLRRISSQQENSESPLLSCLPAGAIAELERVKGPSSLPRPVYACLLRELRHIGFPVVVFDILFSVPGLADADKMLAHEMRSHGGTAILSGYERFAIKKDGAELLVEQHRQPLPLFKEHAAATGPFLVPRTEGFVHGYLRQVQGFGASASLIDVSLALLQSEKLAPSTREKPKSEFTYLWLYGPPGAIRTVPIRDILSGRTPDAVRQTAAKTVVFVGASDPSMVDFEDSFPSLFRNESDANIGGVELAATAFLNLRAGHNLLKLPWLLELASLFSFVLVLGFFAMLAGTRSVMIITCLALSYLVTAIVVFFQYRLFLPIIFPIFIVAPLLAVIALVVRSRTAMDLVMRLAPAPIARRMLAGSSGERSNVETSDATVAFFDVIDSTTIGEKIGNIPFGKLMNDFHDAVSREVENYGGVVTAFTGDGVTTLFDSSGAGSDHAVQACRAATATVQKLRNLNLENANHGLPPLGVRVGMNSGLIAAGRIGAQDRFNFDVVGDAVNIASRLEQLGKTLCPGEHEVILVAPETHQRVQGQGFSFVDCGLQHIPGRTRHENVFRLLVT